MGCLIAFRFLRSRVFALAAVFLFFFAAQGWGSCSNNSSAITVQCSGGTNCTLCPSSLSGYANVDYTVTGVDGKNCESFGQPGTVTIKCTAETGRYFVVDSALYARPCSGNNYGAFGIFNGRICTEPPSSSSSQQSSSSQGQSSSSAPPPSSSSFDPPPDCQTRYCCDSLAQNRPVEIDTIWEGCVPTDPTQPGCIVYSESITPGDTTLGAECNGKSQYMICTKEWTWSESAKQCAQLETNNCIRFTQTDSMCSGIICYATQQHSLSSLAYKLSKDGYNNRDPHADRYYISRRSEQSQYPYNTKSKHCNPRMTRNAAGSHNI